MNPTYFGDAMGQNLTYPLSTPYTITDPSAEWSILLWDYDTPDPDDFMAGLHHVPND